MINEVYILQENSTRDGLNFDYFCKDKTSLKELAIQCFYEYLDVTTEEAKVTKFLSNDIGDIEIQYFDEDLQDTCTFKKFSFIKIPLR